MLSWKVRLGERERKNEENDEECGKIQSRGAYPRDISSLKKRVIFFENFNELLNYPINLNSST